MKILVLNGPNMNLIGIREKEIYGTDSWDEIFEQVKDEYKNVDFIFFQSNIEGEMINYIQKNNTKFDFIICNPAALTNNGYGLLDCFLAYEIKYIEVHISNIFAREKRHRKSIFSKYALGVIAGFGGDVYLLAVKEAILYKERQDNENS